MRSEENAMHGAAAAAAAADNQEIMWVGRRLVQLG